MNRRTFIQLTGLTAISFPALAKAKQESQWISFTKKMPEPGRNIISLTYFNNNLSRNISIGKVLDKNVRDDYYELANGYPEDAVIIELSIDYSHYYESPGGDLKLRDLIVWDANYRESLRAITPKNLMVWHTDQWDKKEEIEQQIKNFSWGRGFPGEEIPARYDWHKCWSPRHGRKKSKYVCRDATYWMYYPGLMKELPPLPEPYPPVLVVENGVKMLIKE